MNCPHHKLVWVGIIKENLLFGGRRQLRSTQIPAMMVFVSGKAGSFKEMTSAKSLIKAGANQNLAYSFGNKG